MRINYETDYRPNYELFLALSWASFGIVCVLLMTTFAGFPLGMTIGMSSIFFLVALYQATFAKARHTRMQTLEKSEKTFFQLNDLSDKMKEEALYLGRGFEWTANHAQALSDLYRDPDRLEDIKKQRHGGTFLHGIGISQEQDVLLLDNESKGHVHIVGTTGSGKTRLFDFIVAQCIMRGEAVITIDPKGDHELKNNMEAAYRRAGREQEFSFFHPAFVDESAAINPLASRQRSSELASRLAAIIPSKQSGDVFQSFSQNAAMGIFYAIERSGVNPTIMDVQRALSEGFGPLCVRALEGWAYSVGADMKTKMSAIISKERHPEKKAVAGALFYQEQSNLDAALSSAEMNNLISLLLHDRDHLKKMVASLVPVVGKLCAGPLATLFSPDPATGRMPKSGKVISLEQVITQKGGCYIGIDTLSDADVGRAIGQMILADLAALAGKNYNFGRTKDTYVNIFVDEASEITNEQLIQLLNKGRGAGFRIFVATQTLSDYEARTGSAAMANMLLGNMNNTIMLRTVDTDTQERLAARLPEVPLSHIMKTTASSMGGTTITGGFSVNHGERLMTAEKPIVAPQSFGDLSDLEFFAVFAKGNLVKGRLPILAPPDEEHQIPSAEYYSRKARDHRYDHEQLAGDPLAESPFSEPAMQPPEMHAAEPLAAPEMPPQKTRMFPFLRWVDVIPGFRQNDKVPDIEPDKYLIDVGLIDREDAVSNGD